MLKWRETSSGVAVHGESIEFFAGGRGLMRRVTILDYKYGETLDETFTRSQLGAIGKEI